MNFFKITLAICLLQLSTSSDNQATFSIEIFNKIAQANTNANIIISPASIQTILALAYIGAEGKTADELRQGLHLGNSSISKLQVAKQFGNLMSKMRSSPNVTMKMANRIYVQKDIEIASTFTEVAQQYFNSKAENVDFSKTSETVKKINNWVAQQTENKIQNLISSDGMSKKNAVILVNAIYFKGTWLKGFDTTHTSKENFHVSKTITKKVDMMYQANEFAYAALSHLDAQALSMRYEGTNIQMLVLLPNELDGLSRLEQKLRSDDLTGLLPRLYKLRVKLFLPKFKIEFQKLLNPILKSLGMQELFTSKANFSSMITNELPPDHYFSITQVVHKAFIEVTEKGVEAAAGSGVVGSNTYPSLPPPMFIVDHPFYFALLDEDTVYFAGHVVNI